MNKNIFAPRKNLVERYSLEGIAKSRGISVEEFKKQIEEERQMKEGLIQKYLDKGYTQEQAKTTALRIMYIPGFSGSTFRD